MAFLFAARFLILLRLANLKPGIGVYWQLGQKNKWVAFLKNTAHSPN